VSKEKKFDYRLLRRIIGLASPYRKLFLFCGLLAVILAPLAAVRPLLIQKMVDEHIFHYDITGMTQLTIVLVVLLLIESFLVYAFSFSTNLLGQSVIRDLRVRVFRHITRLNLSYFDKTPIGTSTTRTINDIETINSVFAEGIITIIADLLTLIVVLAIMLVTSWKLTMVCMTVLPFLVIASYIFKEKINVSFQRVRTEVARMNAFLQERITGMRIVQIFNAERQEAGKFREINRVYTKANLDSVFYYAVFFPVVEIISAAALGLMVWWGARGVIGGEITLGTMVAFPVYISMLFRPIRLLADKFNTLQMGMVAADRVFQLVDDQSFVEQSGTKRVARFQGDIVFDKVDFAYQDDNYVLKNVSFHVRPGQSIALVGKTGSGKSTIISILNRFYEVRNGSIRIDGTDIRDYDLYDLRNRIAVVLQDVFLFSGTVMDNITLHDPAISREQVIEAAKMIGAHAFIERLPGGYDYQVMERGATLSMGQRQLISFVRALVFDPDILILDEATSSIDYETESVIQHAIETLIARRTSLIIAHRLSTIRHVDTIIVMDKGRILESGTHAELLELADGKYRELYEMQFVDSEG
jgi:ATP-binding cassette subfamily B multidrug efflux pump